MLPKFEMIYLQDKHSEELLRSIGITKTVVAGDTRFDRVAEITKSARSIPAIEAFAGGEKLFLAGSSWAPDEEIIAKYINANPLRLKWIFAPHEIGADNIVRLEKMLGGKSIRFSGYDGKPTDARVLIIDNIGMLSSAYRHAYIAAVGGGFGKGIHNILEPACWGIPVLFGPRHEKFREAVELINENGAFTFNSYPEFESIVNKLLEDEAFYLKSAGLASQYVSKNTGATEAIVSGVMSKL
jgi:3-deoxy-D-manno-octulosonic-acid transferase